MSGGDVRQLAIEPVSMDHVYVVSSGNWLPFRKGTFPEVIDTQLAGVIEPESNGQNMEYLLLLLAMQLNSRHWLLPNVIADSLVEKLVEDVIVNPAPLS